MLDVLTPLSDCRQESVEKMERRIWGVSYLFWIWSSSTTFTAYCCFPGMSLQRDFVLWVFVCSVNLSLFFRLPRRGLPRPYRYIQANRLPRLQGYHTRATTLHENFWVQAGSHLRVVFLLFFLSSANTSVLPQQQPQRSHRAWGTPHGRAQHALSHRACRTPHVPTQQLLL